MNKPLNHDRLTKYVSLLADDVDEDHLLLRVLFFTLAIIDVANGRIVFKTALVQTIKSLQERINECDIGVDPSTARSPGSIARA